MATSPRPAPRRSGPLQRRAASVELPSGSEPDSRSLSDGLPGGWVDLQLLLAQFDEDAVVLDCVVSPVGQPGSAKPVAVRIPASLGTEERRELETWLDQKPNIAVLTDANGCLLLLSVDQRSIALELHAH